jgi:Tfp pilus assembly protein PilN
VVDLKKEIKLSDLFKRREKEPQEPAPVEPSAPPEETPKRKAAPQAPQAPLMRAFNLMPREDTREAKGRRAATAQIALAVVAVLLFGALGSLFLMSSSGVTSKKAERDELREKLAALNVPAKPPGDPKAPALASERQTRTAELATALQSRVAWDRLLRDFALVLPDEVWLTTLVAKGAPRDAGAGAGGAASASTQASSFTITGYTHDQEDVARLLARLSVLPELTSVALVSSQRVEVNEREVVQFSIGAAVKQGGGGTA